MKIKLPNKLFLLGFLVSATLLWPLFVAPYFTSHDDVQVIRLYEMNKCIRDLQIPCRWVPDLGGEYGWPLFNYYAPLSYYFGEIFYLITGSLLLSVKIMFITSFLGAFCFMYLLGRRLWGEMGGVLSAVLYSFAPYHAVNFYVRGAMGEMWGLMFYPAIIWALLRLFENKKVINLLLLSFFIFGLITSHNLSAMIFSPIILLTILVLYFSKRDFKFLKYSFVSMILGLLLASFYWLPALWEKEFVHVNTTTIGYFSYTEHFKGFTKLLIDRSWHYGPSVREVPGGEKDQFPYQVGTVHEILFLVAAILGVKFLWRKKFERNLLILFSFLAGFSLFMIHPRSYFIWQLFEPLKYLQFPWRLLGLVIFFVSVVSGSIFFSLQEKLDKWKVWIFGVFILLTVALNFSYFKPERFLYLTDQDLLQGQLWEKQIMRSIFDYLPKSAKAPPAYPATSRYDVKPDEIQIKNYQEGSNWIKFDADVKNLTFVKLSEYYFPYWEVSANGKKREINSKNELGLITFTLDPGRYKVEAKLFDSPVRVVANILSLISFIMFVVLVLTQFPRSRKWVFYYIARVVSPRVLSKKE